MTYQMDRGCGSRCSTLDPVVPEWPQYLTGGRVSSRRTGNILSKDKPATSMMGHPPQRFPIESPPGYSEERTPGQSVGCQLGDNKHVYEVMLRWVFI